MSQHYGRANSGNRERTGRGGYRGGRGYTPQEQVRGYDNRGRPRRGRGGRDGRSGGSYNARLQTENSQHLQANSYKGDISHLHELFIEIDGRSYPAYKQLLGKWILREGIDAFFYKIQSDPYAPPSLLRVEVNLETSKFSKELYKTKLRKTAFCDWLTRKFWRLAHEKGIDAAQRGGGWHGAKGGNLNIDCPGQHVLERSSCQVKENCIEARVTISLPARGRSIQGQQASRVMDRFKEIVERSLIVDQRDLDDLKRHVLSIEKQEECRSLLNGMNLIGFVADGAVLPRSSGADDTPMTGSTVVKFKSPKSLAVHMNLKDGQKIRGMGIRPGVSLIVGGGFHGKSTLLAALEVGMYNHIPGDGREFVCIDSTALSIRAEDGRSVSGVDIRAFINNLPFGKQTNCFSTSDASGSTSQAANIMEAIEAGAKVLLMDEDLAATNFMMRDQRMQMLVPKKSEPITPMVDRIRTLYKQEGVSSVLVVGGSGDYFEVSDTVVMMDCYEPKDVTNSALDIASKFPGGSAKRARDEDKDVFKSFKTRKVSPESVKSVLNGGRGKCMAKVRGTIEAGDTELDISALHQIVELSQSRAVAVALVRLAKMPDLGTVGVTTCVERLMKEVERDGCDAYSDSDLKLGNIAWTRGVEIQAALNRLRGISVVRTK